MKRICFGLSIFILLSVSIGYGLFSHATRISAVSQTSVGITPSFVGPNPENDFTVNVTTSDITDLNAVQYDIIFNPNVLRLDDITDGKVDSTPFPVPTDETAPRELSPGHWRVVQWSGFSTINGSGYLSQLHFHVIGTSGNNSDIELENGVLSGFYGEIAATWSGGYIEVLPLNQTAVATKPATDITVNSATLNGELYSLLASSSANVSFEWGTVSGAPDRVTANQTLNSLDTFSVNLTGLSQDTTYYFRTKAVANTTIVYGEELSFNTLIMIPPTVTTLSATKVGANIVTLNGKLNTLGTATTANVSFEWGTSPGIYTANTTPSPMSTAGAFSFDLSGLSGNTTYYYRAKTIADGIAYGNEKSFTTLLSGCFIATAAYGSYLDPHLDILRDFRDSYLITNGPGRDFVNFYYANSPPIARFITDHPWLKPPIRAALVPVVAMADIVLKLTPVGTLIIFVFLIVTAVLFTVRMRKRSF